MASANNKASNIPIRAKPVLRLIKGGKSPHNKSGNLVNKASQKSSFPNECLLPNGATSIKEQVRTELEFKHFQSYKEGYISRNALYKQLKDLWGKEAFEGTRHCHENMLSRGKTDYAEIAPEFIELPSFLLHMGPRLEKSYSIHRMDNAKGYSPENCVWADKKTQSRVRTNTVYITDDEETLPLTEWAERLDVPAHTLRQRKRNGWSDHEILYGRQNESKSIATGVVWPSQMSDAWRAYLEAAFRKSGGKTVAHKLEFLRKETWLGMQECLAQVEELWSPSYDGDEPTPSESKIMRKVSAELVVLRGHYDYATQRLVALNILPPNPAMPRRNMPYTWNDSTR